MRRAAGGFTTTQRNASGPPDPDGGFRIQAADGRVLAAKQGFAGDIDDATEDEEDVQAVLQMASLTSTVALGERAGRRVRRG